MLLVHAYLAFYSPSDGYTLANGELVGGDFVAFHQAGQTVRSDPHRLYDWEDFAARQQLFFRQHGIDAGILVFGTRPLAYAFSAFSGLSLLHAYLAWTCISLLFFLLSLWIVLRSLSADLLAVLLACLAALAFFVFSVSALRPDKPPRWEPSSSARCLCLVSRRYDFCAGLMLAMSYYKPPLFAGFLLVLLFARHWRVLGGFALGGLALLGATLLSVGAQHPRLLRRPGQPLSLRTDTRGGREPPDRQGRGVAGGRRGPSRPDWDLRPVRTARSGACRRLVPGQSLAESLDRVRLDARLAAKEELLLNYSLLVSFSLLVSLQMVVYDLSILFPFGAASVYVLLRRGCSARPWWYYPRHHGVVLRVCGALDTDRLDRDQGDHVALDPLECGARPVVHGCSRTRPGPHFA